ncbi:amidohydrolase family protein [Dyella sp. 2HG41-7]|uniref:amidohydrolase family protein n=1 Tax=Dyella sp. 2HG41-7 TaxID=2883239 RepID=UPI001F31D02B|nr:amidohydrolase family protein [Dyella sp. 2HG41-7]
MYPPDAAMDISIHGAVSVTPECVLRAPLPIRAGCIAPSARARAYRVDLRDHCVFPGLINAHEHLHINAVPPLPAAEPFPSSYAWICAFQAHFDTPGVVEALQVPKALRYRHGALKNLLAGTTCVAHHDPWHPALDAMDFPVAVLRDYGWSYALGWPEYGPPARASFAATPDEWPWFIHLAEGTDAAAQAELEALHELGCLGPNSVLIHGVGLREQDIDRILARGAAVVWCPRSNRALLGATLDPRRLYAAGRLALGTDSRLSGARDMLEELREADRLSELSSKQLLALATTHAARILRLSWRGDLLPGAPADLVIVEDRGGEAASNLVGIERSQIRAVVRDGVPRIADLDFEEWFAFAGIDTVRVWLDGKPKLLDRALADPALMALEPGLESVFEPERNSESVTAEARYCV